MSVLLAPVSRAQFLRDTLALLWPDAAARVERVPRRARCLHPPGTYLLLPDAAEPRLLVPAEPRLAAAALRRYSALRSRRAAARAAALRCGAGQFLLPDRVVVPPGDGESIETVGAAAVGEPVVPGLHIGPPRANRKPVLQLLNRAADTVAYAKLGADALTDRLVAAEAAALQCLAAARLRTVRVPEMLHHGGWRGRSLLVQSALPAWRGGRADAAGRTAAMREVAAIGGANDAAVRESRFVQRLRGNISTIGDPRTRGDFGRVLDSLPDMTMRFGSWHGDWTPWNMAYSADRVLVWDWERFESGVPVGFDALHYDLQRRLHANGPSRSVTAEFLRDSVQALHSWNVEQAESVAALYLVHIGTRYALDRQEENGNPVGALDRWLLPALRDRLEEL